MPYKVSSHCACCNKRDEFYIGYWPEHLGVFLCQNCQTVMNIPLETGQCPGCGYTPTLPEFFDYSNSISAKVGASTQLGLGPVCPKCHQSQLDFNITTHMNMVGIRGNSTKTAGKEYLEKAIFAYAVLVVCAELKLDPVEVFHYFSLDLPKSLMAGRTLSPPIFTDLRTHLGMKYSSGLHPLEREWLSQKEHLEQPVEVYRQGVAVAHQHGFRRIESLWLGQLGQIYGAQQQFEPALKVFQESLAIGREIGEPDEEIRGFINLGNLYAQHHEIERATLFHRQGLMLAREIGNRAAEGKCLAEQGTCYQMVGQVKQAVELYEQALTIAREVGDHADEALYLTKLRLARHQMGL